MGFVTKQHDADAIIVPNPFPFGYMVNCPVCESGPHLIRDKASADACNHAYPPCGHVLRIDPDKPCTCSRIEKGIFDKLPWNAKKIREKEEYDAETARLEAEHQQERDNAYRTHLDSLSPEDRQAAERAGQSHFEIIEQGRKARESMMANLNPSQIDNTDIINNSDDVFEKAWDIMKIDMERLQQAQNIEQIEGDENMVNVELAPQATSGSCCDAFKQRVEGIFGGGTPFEIGNRAEWMVPIIHQKYGYDLSFDPSNPDDDTDWYDALDCEQIIDFFNEHLEEDLRDEVYGEIGIGREGPWTDMRNEMLDAIQEYESCERGEGYPFVFTGDDDVSVAYF